jgi:ribosomal protein L11 methyltransferase
MAPTGLRIPPCWRILSPGQPRPDDGIAVVLTPGAGFGSGSHETTQLCLRAIAAYAPRHGRPWRMLDFGSGSGILAIGAAKLGARVEAIEIDERAIANARENLQLNGVEPLVRLGRSLEAAPGPFELVVANILRPVLLDVAEPLTARLAPGGALVLSGLVGTDVPELSVRYVALLGGRRPAVYRQADWCALAWR